MLILDCLKSDRADSCQCLMPQAQQLHCRAPGAKATVQASTLIKMHSTTFCMLERDCRVHEVDRITSRAAGLAHMMSRLRENGSQSCQSLT